VHRWISDFVVVLLKQETDISVVRSWQELHSASDEKLGQVHSPDGQLYLASAAVFEIPDWMATFSCCKIGDLKYSVAGSGCWRASI
jgi:hypothetical protein